MEQREQPIGVFDSGLGGISVLRACTALLPQEDFLFFGDSANAPYGEKSLAQVRRLTIAAVDRLLAQGVKAVVVACNTATSAAIHLLRQAHPDLPIIGIEPAVKPAALDVGSSSVIVMATPLTIREDKYQKLAAAFCHEANVISLPCPGLAERVEALVSSVVSEAVSVVVSLPQPARVSASRAEAARMLTAFFVVLFMVFFPHFFLVFILLLVSDKYSLPAFG